jgi:hypothetical protein
MEPPAARLFGLGAYQVGEIGMSSPRTVRGTSTIVAVLMALLLMTAGCSSLSPGPYRDFDDWFTGNPESDHDDLGAESVPLLNRVHGLLLTPPYLTRDLCRIVMIPVTLPYFALREESE